MAAVGPGPNEKEVVIISNKAPGKCWAIKDGSRNGSIHLWDKRAKTHKDYENQTFYYDGAVFRSTKFPGKAIHIANKGTSNGSYLHLWDLAGKDTTQQKFSFDGQQFYSAHCDKTLHLSHGGISNGTKIVLWNAGGDNDKWTIEYTDGSNGGLKNLRMNLVSIFSNMGGKSKGTFDREIEVSRGFKCDFGIDTKFSSSLEAEIGGPLEDLTGKLKTKRSFDLSVHANFSYEDHSKYKEKFTIDLSAPMYIFQLKVSGEWGNAPFSGYGSYFIADHDILATQE